MSIESQADLVGMQRVGRTVALVLLEMRATARVGMTTAELDGVGAAAMQRYGARSAPRMIYGFPGHTCISVNDEIVHGIPGDRRLRSGDVVKIDEPAMSVQAAMAGVGARYYSRRMRQGTSEDRFPAGRLARRSAVREGGSRTPAADRQATALTTRHQPAKSEIASYLKRRQRPCFSSAVRYATDCFLNCDASIAWSPEAIAFTKQST